MIPELNSETVEWILEKMEAITKDIMTNSAVWTPEIIIKRIGEFTALSELLANFGFEPYGIKFRIEYPTMEEYERTASKTGGWD
jgi:hypothetical protein